MSLMENLRRKAATRLLVGGHRGHCPGFVPGEGRPAFVAGDVPTGADLSACPVRENTVENFSLVKDAGLSHIEVDVQLTADGEAVIYHDLDLCARSPLTGPVRDFTLTQLKDAFPINTLDETLAWCAAADMPVALEMKCVLLDMHQTMPILASRVAEALRRHRLFEMSFVLSTDHASLARVKALEPETNLALIVPHVPWNPVRLMEEMDALIYLCFEENLCLDLVRALQGAGYYVDGSVVNGAYRLSRAIALGVDMIESDCPAHTMAQYRRLTQA
jgi:glycerophosphoryl diester phosphodiesterase